MQVEKTVQKSGPVWSSSIRLRSAIMQPLGVHPAPPVQKVFQKTPVTNHGPPQVFPGCTALAMSYSNFVCCTVVLDYVGVVNREIRRTLCKVEIRHALREVRHRVALCFHYRYDRIVGIDQSTFGIFDESRLHHSPGVCVMVALCGREPANVQMSDSFLALFQYSLRLYLRSTFSYGSIIFL